MSIRVAGQAFRVAAFAGLVAGTAALAGCSTLGAAGFGDVTGSTGPPWRTRGVNRTAHGLRSISTGDCASDSNLMPTPAMPNAAEPWSLTSLREKLIKIGAEVARHGR